MLLPSWEGDKLQCFVFFFQHLQGKEKRKRNRGSVNTWEEEKAQYLELSVSFFFFLPLRWEVYCLCFPSPRGRKVSATSSELGLQSGFDWRLSQSLSCLGYRTKLRSGDNGLSPCSAWNSIYDAMFSFSQSCLQVLDVKRFSSSVLMAAISVWVFQTNQNGGSCAWIDRYKS